LKQRQAQQNHSNRKRFLHTEMLSQAKNPFDLQTKPKFVSRMIQEKSIACSKLAQL
jgi:hypothetical protein